ncbi:MAG: endonuclease/exonuclease/phosphatase family protein [Bacteroidetes bacterium]|nr:endonuclease/exonuclease/phosphatase family protein [Bacteroidota bacterium]
MKIATWNIEGLKKNKNEQVRAKIKEIDADIFVLTETSKEISLDNYSSHSSSLLEKGYEGINYKDGENRTTIWSKFPITNTFETYDNNTTTCVELQTTYGNLIVYGTIIGVFANRQPKFDNDLNGQVEDFKKLFPNKQVAIIGDFNIIFKGFAYPSHKAREKMNEVFTEHKLTITTTEIENNIDHIVISDDFLKDKTTEVSIWNEDKILSDHIGVCLTLKKITE